jgi:putative transposase
MANRPPRLERIFQAHGGPLFFVTFNTRKRAPILASEPVHTRFVAFAREAEKRNIAVGRYVIMPDHVHLFVHGSGDFVLSGWVRLLKRCLSQAIAAGPPHWQEGFFDHLVRHDESYAQKWEYVRVNPVRARLVEKPDDWPYQGEVVLIDRA